MATLRQTISGTTYESPFVVASGPLTDRLELIQRAEDNGAGAVSTKHTMLVQPVKGIRQMYAEKGRYGFNPSDKRLDLEDGLRLVRQVKESTKLVVWANISAPGEAVEGWQKIARCFEQAGADVLELNFVCPNISLAARSMGQDVAAAARVGAIVGRDPVTVGSILAGVKAAVKIPVWVKPPAPEIADFLAVAKAVQTVQGDGMVITATPLAAPPVDIYQRGKPKVGTLNNCSFGGMGGPATKQLACRYVAQVAQQKLGFHIVGGGGIESWKDAVEYFMYGADLVSLCWKLIYDGFGVLKTMRQGLLQFMEEQGYATLDEMRGLTLPYLVPSNKLENVLSYAVVDQEKCHGCALCERIGSCTAITVEDKKARVDREKCEGCGLCRAVCPNGSISFRPVSAR
jgi:dihydropyrimidine dehydrogenase (NAD+) subunit PreA